MSDKARKARRGENFEEAIARWQLQLQTEVKRASALPSAMFDACDPMLEAKLAESTEGIFAWLLKQAPPTGQTPLAPEDLPIEYVGPAELVALMRRFAEPVPEPPPDLRSGIESEELGILADACCNGDETVREHAAFRLCCRYGVEGNDTSNLLGSLQTELEHLDGSEQPNTDPLFAQTCKQIAAAALRSITPPDFGPEGGA
jgi:hypothetical protein